MAGLPTDAEQTPRKRKAPKSAFKPGQSGNPNGRPKVVEAFRERARVAVDDLVLARWIQEVRDSGPEWVRASELLAAYGYGKPSQSVEVSGTGNLPTRAEVSAALALLLKES